MDTDLPAAGHGDYPAGTERWLSAIYGACEPAMRRIALGRLGDAAAASDVVHDVFIQLWQHPEQFDEARGSIENLLAMRTRSRCIDVYRASMARVRRERHDESRTISDSVDAAVDSALTSQVVHTSMEQLSPHQRESISLAFFGGLTYQETARALNVPEGTVKSRIRDGLTAMRQSFEHVSFDQSTREPA